MLEHCQDARFVFNIGLAQRSMWSQTRRFYAQKINFATQSRELTELRAELDWVRAGSTVVPQGALRDLDTAFTNFFEHKAGYPQFKKRDTRGGSFIVRDVKVRCVNHRWGGDTHPEGRLGAFPSVKNLGRNRGCHVRASETTSRALDGFVHNLRAREN